MDSPHFAKPEAVTITIEDVVNDVSSGRIRIPSFQRGFRWDAKDVERLLESIRLGYPIGSLLLWKRAAPAAMVEFGGLRFDAPERSDALWVVDGQQRITSLANALIGGDRARPDKRFDWAFDLAEAKFVPRSRANDAAIPLSTLFRLESLLEWVRLRDLSRAQLENAYGLARAIREYKVPAYIVAGDDENKLRDIFDRMNNYGRRLNRAEVFHALHGGSGESMSSLRDLADYVDNELGFGRIDEPTLMSAVLARRGANVFREVRHEFNDVHERGDTASEFPGENEADAFRKAADALRLTVGFLRDEASVPHFGFLAYRYLLVVLVRFFAHFPQPDERNRGLLRRWYWRAALLGPEPMKGWTQTLLRYNAKVVPRDETGSIQRLLELITEVLGSRDLGASEFNEPFRFTSARSRAVLCALWSRNPRQAIDPPTAYAIPDSEQTLRGQSTARLATLSLVPKKVPAALFIALEGDNLDTFATKLRQDEIEDEWLYSHGLDKDAAAVWRRGETDEFLKRRLELLFSLFQSFLKRQAEWGFEDTPPLQVFDFDMDEDEVSDDVHG